MTRHWLDIIGVTEGGTEALSPAARAAVESAKTVIGPPRHLALIPGGATRIEWPVPFADGLPLLMEQRGTPTAVLVSGDPFWFGAGSVITRELAQDEWRAHPAPSVFSLAAARLGWPLEKTACIGLHAAPMTRLRPHLGGRCIITLRDGAAVHDLAAYLAEMGFGESPLHVLEALGGPQERITTGTAETLTGDFAHPVAAAIEPIGPVLPLANGRPDTAFSHDGQITKRPVRALTLSALSPRPGEHLWDLGAGSGSIAVEWLMSHPACTASAVERRADRIANIVENAHRFGQDRLNIVQGSALDVLEDLPKPDVIFVGGGLTAALLDRLLQIPARLVVNAVTIETEALVLTRQADLGGELLRVQMSRPKPLGGFRGWQSAYPLIQWTYP